MAKRRGKGKRFLDVINFVVIILFIIIAILLIYNRKRLEITTLNEIQRYGYFGLFLLNFILEFIPQFITPVFTYFPAILLEMNMYFAIFFVVLGSVLGSTAGFFMGRRFGYGTVEDLFGFKRGEKMIKFMDKYGRYAVSLAAISPFPYIPMIIGSLRLSKKNFLLFGIIPRTIGLIVFGYLFYLGFVSI